jgi:hypothetical protein
MKKCDMPVMLFETEDLDLAVYIVGGGRDALSSRNTPGVEGVVGEPVEKPAPTESTTTLDNNLSTIRCRFLLKAGNR